MGGIGVLYHDGVDTPVDLEEAVRWYRRGARAGDAWSQFCLGRCNRDGEGVRRNLTRACQWLKKAADQGLTEAALELANLGDPVGD